MKRSNAHFSQHINYRDDAKKLRPCAYRKVRHLTRGAAEFALRQRESPGDPREFATAKCDSCGHWHVEVVGGVPPLPDFEPVALCPRGKRRHRSTAEAEAVIESMKRSGNHRPECGVLNVYECSECGDYHVGHKPGTAPARSSTLAAFIGRGR